MLKNPPLIIDNCVLGNLYSAEALYLLQLLYTDNIIIPTHVLEEATLKSELYSELSNMVEEEIFQTYQIVKLNEIRRFAKLERRFKDNGEEEAKGEAAVLTIAEILSGTVCSDNLSDVMPYIKRHDMSLKTTLSILYDAYYEEVINYKEGDRMIKRIIKQGNRIPVTDFQQVIDWFEKGRGRQLY